ncbi:MAG: NADH-quinone oxidoreductase subunit L [Desulfuromonadales bacterium]|nr:NADH-quinone oxidoreductase subunit L [Desulfuromonadales bacterium]
MTVLLLVIPLIGFILVNIPPPGNLRKFLIACPLLLSVTQVALMLFPRAGWWNGFDVGRFFLPFLRVDGVSMLMLLAIGLVVFASSVVSIALIKDARQQYNFINLVLLSLLGMNGIVMVTDLFSLYVFLEIVSVCSFILIALQREREMFEGAFKYIFLSAIATILMLTSTGILFMYAGGTSFAALAGAISSHQANSMVIFSVILFLIGLFIKGGIVPFHGWLPDAYSASAAPVSILLAGIVTKVSGVYTLIRLVTEVFGATPKTNQVLLFVGALSIVVGALAALGQKDFKRMLAYSSISQVGYIILSLGAGSPLGVAGAIFHLFNHTIFKAQLFMNATAVEVQTGKRDLDSMGGFASRMPITGTTSIIAFLSAAGIPPLAGFWSKLVILIALLKSGHHVYMVIAVLASLLTLAYFLTLQRKVFFGELAPEHEHVKEAGWLLTAPALAFTIIIIATGLALPFLYNTIILPIGSFL